MGIIRNAGAAGRAAYQQQLVASTQVARIGGRGDEELLQTLAIIRRHTYYTDRTDANWQDCVAALVRQGALPVGSTTESCRDLRAFVDELIDRQ